jgi:hypothetical protein
LWSLINQFIELAGRQSAATQIAQPDRKILDPPNLLE